MRDLQRSARAPLWLTVSEAARYLGVSEATLRRWTDDGLIPAFRTPGRHRRYLLDSLDRFQEEQSQVPDEGFG